MNDLEILKKAADKAIRNGWNPATVRFTVRSNDGGYFSVGSYDLRTATDMQEEYHKNDGHLELDTDDIHPNDIIFDHDFAKAFWGDSVIDIGCVIEDGLSENKLPAWKYHLQFMVLTEHPLKYLERFLND